MLERAIENTGAFNGFIGGFLRKQYQERSDILVKAIAAGDDAAISAASKALIRSEQTALYTHATLLQIGIGSTTANVTKLTMLDWSW